MKARSTLIATIVAGLGAGAAKLIYDKRGSIKEHAEDAEYDAQRIGHNVSVKTHLLNRAYDNLSNTGKAKVCHINALIMPCNPKRNGKKATKFATDYCNTLEYLTTRYEYHTNDCSKYFEIPYRRMRCLTIALLKQGIIASSMGIKSIRQHKAERALDLLSPCLTSMPQFERMLKNIIAEEIK